MALTPSTMLPLGTLAPDFALPDTQGAIVRRDDFADRKALLVMFVCNHCPYVKHMADALGKLGRDYAKRDIGIVAIMSNDVANYPEDSPEKMKTFRQQHGWPFAYLYDESQDVARAYTAACTPDFFLFDADRRLVYRGQFDDSRPTRIRSGVYDSSQSPPTGADLRAAMEAVLNDKPVNPQQKPSMGCNIKWKQTG